jgi:hypothetical protein
MAPRSNIQNTADDDFDLSMVAAAMDHSQPPPPSSLSVPSPLTPSTPSLESDTSSSQDTSSNPLANIDLSTLTENDRALLQPLLDLLGTDDAEPPETDEETAEVEKRLNQASVVADGLESMLDGLLKRLGGMIGDVGGLEEEVEEESGEQAEEKKVASEDTAEEGKDTSEAETFADAMSLDSKGKVDGKGR